MKGRDRYGSDLKVKKSGSSHLTIEVQSTTLKPKSGRLARTEILVEKLARGKEQELAGKLVDRASSNGPDVKVLCESYGLRREELGRLTGFSLRALADWTSGKLPSQPAYRRLHEVRRLLDALSELVDATAIPEWLRRQNPAFDNLSPLQTIEVGEIDRLWAMIHERAAGTPG